MRFLIWFFIPLLWVGCANTFSGSGSSGGENAAQKRIDPDNPSFSTIVSKPLPPEKTKEVLETAGGNWAFGQGIGETAVTVGTIAAFPPYAIYVVGNAALSLAGYERMDPTNLLPDDAKEKVNLAYDKVTESPGRVVAAVSKEEFRTKERISADYDTLLNGGVVRE